MKLSIVSQNPRSEGRVYRPYPVDGIDTVGVHPDEPYGILFQNHTYGKVQVVVSVDGRNVLTGRDAELTPDKDNFVVDVYGRLSLNAWPETNEYGARFVFTDVDSSVAVHTPGELGAIGYISVAVYTDADPEIPPLVLRGGGGTRGGMQTRGGAGTGAGETISQHIGTARGLRKPQFSQMLQIRYIWWDDLVERLRESGVQPAHPTGFVERPLADLGDTPRLGGTEATQQGEYERFIR